MLDPTLVALCAVIGITPTHMDQRGVQRQASAEAVCAVLTAMGLQVATAREVTQTLERLTHERRRMLPALMVGRPGEPIRPIVQSSHDGQWVLTLETGEQRTGAFAASAPCIDLDSLPVGYHRLIVETRVGACAATLLCAPASCHRPGDARQWGVTAQVHALRRDQDDGIGDYGAMACLTRTLGGLGADFIGLSPMHALFSADAAKISPYSPSSRLCLAAGLIDLHAVEDYRQNDTAPPSGLIDYPAVFARKRAALERIWREGGREAYAARLQAYREKAGPVVQDHAVFEALSDRFAHDGLAFSGAWPAAYQRAGTPEVSAFIAQTGERIAFHAWLQYLADDQLAKACRIARASGMRTGLYRDLAVGADRYGSEVWSAPHHFLTGLSIGAPPDPMGPAGQDWGMPPFDPHTLATHGLSAFRELVAVNMRYAGALRIDHAFQLQRLFVLPNGGPARDGVYLDYPFEAMLAVLRIESERARCVIIAEDLGTTPEGFSRAVMDAGLMSYRIMPFEQDAGGFVEPALYPRNALAAFATHDLATVKGWWRGLDIDMRECFDFYDALEAAAERRARAADRARLHDALAAQDLPCSADGDEAPVRGIARFLARTPSLFAAVQLEDVLGDPQQANLPGPSRGYPNWRRRYSATVDALAAPGSPLLRTAALFAREGRGRDSAASAPPRATYRLQLHKGFTFDDAAAVAPYLARLGISHVYVSPITLARPGSMHGYDVMDPTRLNPELGGEAGFATLNEALDAHGLRLIVDIVPNHMGVGGSLNPFWLDMLQWGRRSIHADLFDIDWDKPGADGKVIAPFLGKPLQATLAAGELAIRFDAARGAFAVWYYDDCYPVSPLDYGAILALAPVVSSMAEGFDDLRCDADNSTLVARAHLLQRRLAQAAVQPPFAAACKAAAHAASNPTILAPLLARQAYRLIDWTHANTAINYRRFFDITSLAGLRMEDDHVFDLYHQRIAALVHDGKIHGLRVDHVDGLADPRGYLERLDAAVGPDLYTLVEKIIEPEERLPAWPIAGTTGYDALRLLDGVFFDPRAADALDAIWRTLAVDHASVDVVAIKKDLIDTAFVAEFAALVRAIIAVLGEHPPQLEPALRALLAAFPVYRTYARGAMSEADRAMFDEALGHARTDVDAVSAFDTLSAVLAPRDSREPLLHAQALAQRRFQQLTGPLMAKSFEDTLFYRHVRFIAANEVGCGPDFLNVSVDDFHAANLARLRHWPTAMIATATHDTKRGEDARARLLAASMHMGAWRDAWSRFESALGDRLAQADLYLLFQSLIASAPVPFEHTADFEGRTQSFFEKALREARLRTCWTKPNADYEAAARACVTSALAPDGVIAGPLRTYIMSVACDGARLAVARTVMKCTIPGVPDIYQGTEFTDLSFVDPDNRRPVDFAARERACDETPLLEDASTLLAGSLKQHALMLLLADRARRPLAYSGAYTPLPSDGAQAPIAYQRGQADEALIVVARRDIGPDREAGAVRFPAGSWRHGITGAPLKASGDLHDAAQILQGWPAAWWRRDT